VVNIRSTDSARSGSGNVGVSLSHDEQFCLCVSGYGRQGCDIAITERSPQDWIALLSFKRELLLQQLLARGVESIEPGKELNRAAWKLWKATEAMDIDLVLERFSEKMFYFESSLPVSLYLR
jgi:enediyne polyketide synthase